MRKHLMTKIDPQNAYELKTGLEKLKRSTEFAIV